MRLEFESNTKNFPQVENSYFEDVSFSVAPTFDELLKKGIVAAQNGERDLARKLLSQATAINPANEDAWLWLASISDYPEELQAFLDRVLEINPDNKRAIEWRAATNSLLAKTFVQRAETAQHEGSTELAGQCLARAFSYDEDCESAWELKALMAESESDRVEIYERILTINPENTSATKFLASIFQFKSAAAFEAAKESAANGERKKAIELLDEFLTGNQDSVDGWILKSHLVESLDEKVEALKKAIDIDPENEAAHSGLAFLSFTFGEQEENSDSQVAETAYVSEYELSVGNHDHSEDACAETEEAELKLEETASFVDPNSSEYQQVQSFEMNETFDSISFEDLPEVIDVYDVTEAVAETAVEVAAYDTKKQFEEDPYNQLPSINVDAVNLETVESENFNNTFLFNPSHFENETHELVQTEPESISFPMIAEDNETDAVTIETDSSLYESLSPLVEDVQDDRSFTAEVEAFVNAPVSDFDVTDEPLAVEFPSVDEQLHDEVNTSRESPADPEPELNISECQYCQSANDAFAFECSSCKSILTFADVESLLAGSSADREVVQNAVTKMEGEWNLREFNVEELTTLSIGHFNLRNFEPALKYLQEASRLDPNNVILAGHVNTVAIRLDEMRRQSEIHDAMPKGKSILVVDDSPTVRKLISGKLEKSGHNVICAIDGIEALAKIEMQMPDLVLLDITMPRMDGYEVCKQIRANPAGKLLPVVMISGKDGFFDKVRGRMAGATGYITKPFGPETLMKALDTYLLPEQVETV